MTLLLLGEESCYVGESCGRVMWSGGVGESCGCLVRVSHLGECCGPVMLVCRGDSQWHHSLKPIKARQCILNVGLLL